MRRIALALLVLALSAAASAEDVIVLDNGREARGKILEETEAGVKLDIGGGKMFYPRSKIREVRHGAEETEPGQTGPEAPAAESREEGALLYEDGRRAGTRVLRTARTPEGWRFEEELVLFDEKGAPEIEVRTTERDDASFQPLAFQVRESAGDKGHRMVVGEVRSGRLHVTVSTNGDRKSQDAALPEGARLQFAAREVFLRDTKALGGKLELSVYVLREAAWRRTVYSEGGRKPLDADGKALEVRVIVRTAGDVVEHEWIDERLATRMAELSGEKLRALASTLDVVSRMKRGDTERALGPDSAARTTYADPEGGWRIGKPDPSWTFEPPAVKGAGALLVVRNAPLFATVDVLRDPAASPGVTLERASESLQRLCRTIAPDFRVEKDGFFGEGASRYYWLEATATTKGERTRTLARIVVKDGKVWRLLAACPERAFEGLRVDFEKILGSFVAQ